MRGTLVGGLLALAACSGPTATAVSSALDTVDISVSAVGSVGPQDTLTVNVILRDPDDRTVELVDGDALTVTPATSNDVFQLQATTSLNEFVYEYIFDPAIVDAPITIGFDRPNHTSATTTFLTAPPAFAIEPISGFAAGAATTLKWDNADATSELVVTVQGDCFDTVTIEQAQDTGMIEIPAIDATEACFAHVTVTRRRIGAIDGTFFSGSAYGQQIRRLVTPISVP